KKQLLEINGFGKIRVEKYGAQILEVIKDYCEENNIETDESTELEKSPETNKQKVKSETHKISLELFQAGKSIFEIAQDRKLTTTTIFGHLSKFISTGEVQIADLISEKHFKELSDLIPKQSFESLS